MLSRQLKILSYSRNNNPKAIKFIKNNDLTSFVVLLYLYIAESQTACKFVNEYFGYKLKAFPPASP